MRKTKNVQKSLFCQSMDHPMFDEWQRIANILDQHPEFLDWVQADLAVGLKSTSTGAHGMTAEQVLRAAILKQSNCWTYRELEFQIFDSQMTKAFLKLDFDESYRTSSLQANIKRIRAETWEQISRAIVVDAKTLGLETGKVVRMDSTPIEANVHRPTDSSLLFDCIRSSNIQFEKLREQGILKSFAAVKTTEAKSLYTHIFNSKDADKRVGYYRSLVKMARRTHLRVSQTLTKLLKKGYVQSQTVKQLTHLFEIIPHIIEQTVRRVFKDEIVNNEQKYVSIFEPHTDIIVKGVRDVVYGHKTFFSVGKSGLILDTMLVQGNPKDSEYFIDLLERHQSIFQRYPRQVVTDGGFASEENLFSAKDLGIKDVCFSKAIGIEIEEMVKSRWVFEKLRNFRAGIESIISCLKRGYDLNRVTWKGVSGFASYVHSTVLAFNLVRMAKIQSG